MQGVHFVCCWAAWNLLRPARASHMGLPRGPPPLPNPCSSQPAPTTERQYSGLRLQGIPLQVSPLLFRCCHQQSSLRGRSKTRRRPRTAQQLLSSDSQAFCKSRKQRFLTETRFTLTKYKPDSQVKRQQPKPLAFTTGKVPASHTATVGASLTGPQPAPAVRLPNF